MEIVSRPSAANVNISREVINAVSETAVSGKAVRIKLNGLSQLHYQAKLRYQLMKHGLRLNYNYFKDDDTMVAWAEKRD
jgi:hypothetical protein